MSTDIVFHVDIFGWGETINIMPYVHEAMATCPYQHDLTALEIAKLVVMAVKGKYIPVDTLDRVEDRMLGALTGTVIKWIQSERRMEQVKDPGLRELRPYIELVAGPHYCQEVAPMIERWLRPEELVRLPLPRCSDMTGCSCQYHTAGRRDVEQRGVVPRKPG